MIRQKWIHACGLSMNDELKCIFICVLHFAPEDVENGNPIAKSRLKKGVVPKVNVPNNGDVYETIVCTPEVTIDSVGCQNYIRCDHDEIPQKSDSTPNAIAKTVTCKLIQE